MTRKEEVEDARNLVTSNFSIRTHPVEILFDSGVTHLFIFARLMDTLQVALTCRYFLRSIALPDRKVVS